MIFEHGRAGPAACRRFKGLHVCCLSMSACVAVHRHTQTHACAQSSLFSALPLVWDAFAVCILVLNMVCCVSCQLPLGLSARVLLPLRGSRFCLAPPCVCTAGWQCNVVCAGLNYSVTYGFVSVLSCIISGMAPSAPLLENAVAWRDQSRHLNLPLGV